MLLAVDAGNTNIVFALLEDGVIRARWRIATDPRRTADEYAVWLHQLIALEGLARSDVSAPRSSLMLGGSPSSTLSKRSRKMRPLLACGPSPSRE